MNYLVKSRDSTFVMVYTNACLMMSTLFIQKWHPDKKQGEENATSRFQEINEAYQGEQ
jgi:hypothetical protein